MLPPIVDDLDEARDHIREHGLALLAGQLSSSQLEQARAATYAAAEDDRIQGRQTDRFGLDYGEGNVRVWNILDRHPVFRELVQLPVVLELLRDVIGWPALLGNISANIALPGGEGGMLHADQIFVPRPWPPAPQGMNFAWLLDDYTADNGATEVVPGSHLAGDDVDPSALEASAEPVIAPAGTLMVFESRVWHRTGSNRSAHSRAALFGWYSRPIYRTQENWFLSLDDRVVEDASDDLLVLLGYKTQGFGLVYGRSPR
jgi:ectoine hydroxylase-related dioxygenase (phytanoyl-CoA dioxygenase family)